MAIDPCIGLTYTPAVPQLPHGSLSHGRAKRLSHQRLAVLLALSAIGAGVAANPPAARSAILSGNVRVVHPLPAAPREPLSLYPRRGYAGPLRARHTSAPAGCECVVYLADPPAAPPAPPDTFTMVQHDEEFVPHILPIRTGSVVRFPNRDPFFHNVFSYSRPKRFDLGKYPTGHSKSVRFTRPGLVEVFCEIHAFMHAYVLVLPHPYFDAPDADGHFVIRSVPPGRYRLVVWRPGVPESEESIVVPDGQHEVEVSVEL